MAENQTSTTQGASRAAGRGPIVNDFSIQVATANGSGSQSSNAVLLRAIFQMGVPVSGKNLFPSNIAGLPTWYTIRASKDGYVARKKEIDVLVAMNPETAQDDVRALPAGAAVVFDAPLALDKLRDDLVFYPVAFDRIVEPVTTDAKLRKLLRNMAYVGVLARLLSVELVEVEAAIGKQFGKKAKARELNVAAARAGFEHAAVIEKRDPFAVRRMEATRGKLMVDGNSACALGALFAGVTVVTWYPITPSSSLVETLVGLSEEVPDRAGREGHLRRRPGRGRARGGRDGHRRGLGGGAGDDRDLRPGRLPHERVRGARLLRRDPGGDLRRAAGRALHRPADPDRPG